MAFSDEIQKLYISYFNRPADPGGLAYWINQGNQNGENTAAIANAFSASPEYKKTFAEETSTAIVNQIYQNLFGRAAEADGLQYWSSRLDNGTFNLGNIVIAIFNGAQNSDSLAVTNKTLAATQFTAHLTTTEQIAAYTTDRAFALASKWLSGALTQDWPYNGIIRAGTCHSRHRRWFDSDQQRAGCQHHSGICRRYI